MVDIIIKMSEDTYKDICESGLEREFIWDEDKEVVIHAVKNGTPLTPDMLADLLMEERIRGELHQDISYSKDVVDNVKCKLSVDIIDRRPCYCGAELREVWRKSEET